MYTDKVKHYNLPPAVLMDLFDEPIIFNARPGLELSFRVGVRGVFGVKNNTRVPRDRVGPWSRGVGDGPSPTEKN